MTDIPMDPSSQPPEITLFVLLHAFDRTRDSLAPLESLLRLKNPAAIVHRPALPLERFSTAQPEIIALRQVDEIEQLLAQHESEGRRIAQIVLFGHSLGGLLARKIEIIAHGERPEAPFEARLREAAGASADTPLPARPWAPLIQRVVLAAGMNRGWHRSPSMGVATSLKLAFASWADIARSFFGLRPWVITQVQRGQPFIIQLRLQSLAQRRAAAMPSTVVQLLGSRDDVVSPGDSVDLVVGHHYHYLEVPFSGHDDVIDIECSTHGQRRCEALTHALCGKVRDFEKEALEPDDEPRLRVDPRVTDVAFVVHGIRDLGHWTHKIARRIKRVGDGKFGPNGPALWATETASYGYFAMLPFLLSRHRRAKLAWLMDQYTELRARYPNARISFVAHSNGTYLVAQALLRYASVRAHRIVFAGSVVPHRFDWSPYLTGTAPRVDGVLNLVATADWVIAFFPRLLQQLGSKELGCAGHHGFVDGHGLTQLQQMKYLRGGHSAGIKEEAWQAIAEFVVEGGTVEAPIELHQRRRAWWVVPPLMPWLAWLLPIALIGLLLRALPGVASAITDAADLRGALLALATVGVLRLVWTVLTRL